MADKQDRLVIAIASSAVAPLDEASAASYREGGKEEYRKYQHAHEKDPLPKGPAFSFIRRLLRFNELLGSDFIEVVLLSRNDCDTGSRVIESLRHYGITQDFRAMFLDGKNPCDYLDVCDATLFLTEKEKDVAEAVRRGFAAGRVLREGCCNDDADDDELRIAFDFDGVLADASGERRFQEAGLAGFIQYEHEHQDEPHQEGPMANLLKKLMRLRQMEHEKMASDPSYGNHQHLFLSLVTARGTLSYPRVINTLRNWNILFDQSFFLSSDGKAKVLEKIHPHIYFDDKLEHNLIPAQHLTACIHVLQK